MIDKLDFILAKIMLRAMVHGEQQLFLNGVAAVQSIGRRPGQFAGITSKVHVALDSMLLHISTPNVAVSIQECIANHMLVCTRADSCPFRRRRQQRLPV